MLAKGSTHIRTALGLHPQIAHERKNELALFEGLLSEARYVGEIGLDGSLERNPYYKDQLEVFEQILRFTSQAGGRVISIHSRRAGTDVLDALTRHPRAGLPVLHWFSGTKAELERAKAIGCWFSVGPAMLKGKRGQDLVDAMPRDRVLTETDGPFATRNGHSLEPTDVQLALDVLSQIWRVDKDEVSEIIMANFRRLVKQAA